MKAYIKKNKIEVGDRKHRIVYNDNGLIIVLKQMNAMYLKEEDSYFHISNDFGRSFFIHRVMYNDLPVFITAMESIDNYIFCQSTINSSYFYFDKDLRISYYRIFVKVARITVHPEYVNYVSKLVIIDTQYVSY
ncbi:hypothetical protein RF11_00667 [Thelohanellus kitauei]|uniref:Uncharacterized protein n=1 Tax=Thelohanellus kitauei TaxID=669202 RepID=A0A0C2MX36_THEKT|nr:hypothetical protein RF11_00667 [Thelohanellus kitauei]